MFVGWELIGVVSYLLINYYFTRIQANKAALSAFITYRIGDWLLSTSFLLCLLYLVLLIFKQFLVRLLLLMKQLLLL
jgi:NADH:ubiquinone oxidoreductase subunit 5 (subunit L)/multisubunit Na+/H+ antiporter MnhA subunit